MDELAFYVTRGDPADKKSQESVGVASSIQTSHHFASFRNADCPLNGAALTGMGPGERLFVAGRDKALITAYAWGKESADQMLPVPENMSCLAVVDHPNTHALSAEKPQYHVPWLLIAGSKSGKLYVWELASGDLLCVKDAHYQELTCIRVTKCGTFIVTGGLDSRVMVWSTLDLVSGESTAAKPFASFTDHSLAITDIVLSDSGIVTDLRVISSSRDSTVRIYDIMTKSLLTTFVFDLPVECITRDPAGRALYAGLQDGLIRQLPMYVVNAFTHVLEAVGGHGKIVTVESDPNLKETFVHHKTEGACHVTRMAVSMDGMLVISGDSAGRVFVADIVTKQVVKAFTPCKSAIAHLEVAACSTSSLKIEVGFEKKHRLMPTLKRVLVSEDPLEHTVNMQISETPNKELSFEDWIQQKAQEEFEFKTQRQEVDNGASNKELEDKLLKVSNAYNSLKTMYEQLHAEHTK